ncbi:MAG: YggT family protein [Pseudomonadota bacterium]
MKPIIQALIMLLDIYIWILIFSIIFSWLYAFNVINSGNRFVGMVGEFLYKITEPALRPIRRILHRILPDLGGIDISPVFLFLLIYVIQMYLQFYVLPVVP